ncbi:MAG: KTSC domain-containing protein [Candidatus Cloacimonadota bacterium]|nr:KTSC domain-containing protein [Candidatus Cloacimonadota bacterium]
MVAIGYDSETRILEITFKQGETYPFCNVPENIFIGLKSAQSHGGYYNDHIRDKYQC